MICKNCGNELLNHALYCSSCGKKQKNREKIYNEKEHALALKNYIIMGIIIYGLAILTSFICNLAVDHRLSWFYIVLSSIAISFSLTHLPLLLKKQKLISIAMILTGLIYALLLSCQLYLKKGWLLNTAYPIATYPIFFAWLIILVIKYIKLNWFFKSSIISLISAVLIATINIWIDHILFGFNFFYLGEANNHAINPMISLFFLAYFVIGFILGMVLALKKDR